MPSEFLKLKPSEVRALDREKTVFIYAVGGLEDHGDHLPMGCDLFEAEGFARETGIRIEKELEGWKAVLMPPAPLAVDPMTRGLAISTRGYVLRDYLVDSTRPLIFNGFRHFVCFTGTRSPRSLTAIEEAGRMIGRGIFSKNRATLVSALSSGTVLSEVIKNPLTWVENEHGGERDTSLALYFFPNEVGVDYQSLQPRRRTWRAIFPILKSKDIRGYWGNPAQATKSKGQDWVKKKLDDIFPQLRAVWEGANANGIFRSWYSIFPPNKSFFKSWVLLSAVLAIFTLWAFLFSQSLSH